MTDPVPSKDQVSLDDLKRAISYATVDADDFDSDAARERAKAEAWRMAFEYLARFHQPGSYVPESPMDQAMRLIREKLP